MASKTHQFFFGREWGERPYLISPFFDFMLAGGLAVIVFFSLFFVAPVTSVSHESLLTAAALSAALAYVINDPHFTASYLMLYRNYPQKLKYFRQHRGMYLRYLNAGVIAPLAMILYLAYGCWANKPALFGYAFNAMLVLVVWHYTKQAFGVFMMLSALKKVFYTPLQRRWLLINCYIAWLCYCLVVLTRSNGNIAATPLFPGINYSRPELLDLPMSWLMGIGFVFMACALISVLVIIWNQKRASYTALIGYSSIYYLLFAGGIHPLWVFFYPAFHSLQYMLFVYAYKRGEKGIRRDEHPHMPLKLREGLLAFTVVAVLLGALLFTWAPETLEYWINPNKTMFLPLVASFAIFVNIHHYFIDNVIWRRENAEVGKYLFYRK